MPRTKSPVATTPPAPKSADVMLRCEDLGIARPFAPAHAAALLAYQEQHRITGNAAWQPVEGADTETA